MANWYQMLMGQIAPQQTPAQPVYNQPVNKMQLAMQAMMNPAAFVKNAIPDIPDAIANNPNQILGYLQQTRGLTNANIQQVLQMAGGMR